MCDVKEAGECIIGKLIYVRGLAWKLLIPG